eukprot:GHVU01065587.1.p1 GENE.GHVU01065587.1~~GHVU01065587.1.p1  ORF type:complete len:385 (-),score=87.08 GHVU01065587.1:565-1620(-)
MVAAARSGSGRKYKSRARTTLCVSTQVGCAMRCNFCATGTMGLKANLLAGEILEQLLHATRLEPIRNVVFMGMGEPLDNYAEVVSAIRGMSDPRLFGISERRVTVSTVGVVPRLRRLYRDLPNVSLALSLHAPTQQLRELLVPSAKGWPIENILSAADEFVAKQRSLSAARKKSQMLFVEYVMLGDVNDSPEAAAQLAELLRPRREYVHVNLIPYNTGPANEGQYRGPSRESLVGFADILKAAAIRTTIRRELGQDIQSACGQLVLGDSRSRGTVGGGGEGGGGGGGGDDDDESLRVKAAAGAPAVAAASPLIHVCSYSMMLTMRSPWSWIGGDPSAARMMRYPSQRRALQ